MAQYLVLAPTFLHAAGTSGPTLHQAGATVFFAGEPGAALFPLDAEARAAHKRVLRGRNQLQKDKAALQVRKYRRGLTKRFTDILDSAQVEVGADHG